jgi:hypothetical protein
VNTHATTRSRKPRAPVTGGFGPEYQPGRWGGRKRGAVPEDWDGGLCCICGRPVRRDHSWVLLSHTNGQRFPEPADKEEDLSLYAVGPECLKRCPKEFVREPFEDQR